MCKITQKRKLLVYQETFSKLYLKCSDLKKYLQLYTFKTPMFGAKRIGIWKLVLVTQVPVSKNKNKRKKSIIVLITSVEWKGAVRGHTAGLYRSTASSLWYHNCIEDTAQISVYHLWSSQDWYSLKKHSNGHISAIPECPEPLICSLPHLANHQCLHCKVCASDKARKSQP